MDPYPEPISVEIDHDALSVDRETVERLISHVVDKEGASLVHVSVVLSGHDRVRRLNQAYLDHDYNTDVLSFSLAPEDADEPTAEGEVYVDLDTASERHDEFNTPFEREVYRYVVHGLLHLLGYDDATEKGQRTMRSLEDQYLDAFLESEDFS